MVGRGPKWIASQIGHTDPALTFSVYQQVATRRFIDEQASWEVMRFADEPLQRAYQRQMSRAADPSFRPLNRPLAQKDDLHAILDAGEQT